VRPPEDAFIKGSSFNNLIAAVRETYLPSEVERLLAALSAPARAAFGERHLATAWVPVSILLEVHGALGATLSPNDPARIRAVGRASLKRDIKGAIAVFIRVLSPNFVIRRAGVFWEQTFKNYGRVEIFDEKPTSVGLRYGKMTGAHAAFWHIITGSNMAICEAVRVTAPRVEITSGGQGETAEMLVRWHKV
jgi:hypothetical protein